MSMDDNYIMAENMRQLAEENPSLQKQIDILQKRLKIAQDTLVEIGYPGYLTPLYQPWEVARLALENMEKIK